MKAVRWLFVVTLVAYPVQLLLIAFLSEPYPAPIGPLFMGNRELPEGIVNFRQDWVLRSPDGAEVRVSPVVALGIPEPFATNIATVRFPIGAVDESGIPAAERTFLEELSVLGHRFRQSPLHPRPQPVLSPVEQARIRRNLGADDNAGHVLIVRWIRELYSPAARTWRDTLVINEYVHSL